MVEYTEKDRSSFRYLVVGKQHSRNLAVEHHIPASERI